MALTSYMKVQGKKSGQVKGDCQQGGDKKDSMLVYNIDHKLHIPRDTHTGLPTGQRVHEPFRVTKHIDNATPKLNDMCAKGEHCDVTVDYYRIKEDGSEEKYYTIKLSDAIIVGDRHYKPMTFVSDNEPFHDMEEVSFTYSKITWTYHNGNIEATDDWKGGK